jgi:hypothetical protein
MGGGLISEKQRGLSAKTGPRVDFKETRGLLWKILGNIDLRIIFQRVKVWIGSTRGEPAGRARSTVDRRWCGARVPERGSTLTGVRPPVAPVHQSSPAGAQKRERGARGARLEPHRSSGGGVEAGRGSSVERSEQRMGEVR